MEPILVDGKLKRNPSLRALQSCVPAGSASSPIARWIYPFSAPLRWWRHSTARIVAEGFCKFPIRTLYILKRWSLFRHGVPIAPDREALGLKDFCSVNDFLLAYSRDMEWLQKEHPWMTALEAEVCFLAFQRGAIWAIRNVCSEKRTESLVSCG